MKIAIGFCQCGCGSQTTLAKMTSTRDGTVKGQPVSYLKNHHGRLPRKPVHFGHIGEEAVVFIPLQNGKETIIDRSEYRRVRQVTCYFDTGYARITGRIKLHRFILGTPPGVLTDHKNRNRLDNRRSNLRTATGRQNAMNRSVRKDNKCGLKGVCRSPGTNRWVAQIAVAGVNRVIGRYGSKEEAHAAYSDAALQLYGDFACVQ